MKYIATVFFITLFTFLFTFRIPQVKALSGEPFISEYVEGSSFNKALEIYNPTSGTISLDNYKLINYVGGSATVYNLAFTTGATINSGGTYVVCNSGASVALLAKCNQTGAGVMTFTGDDTIVLAKTDGTLLDVIGQIGFDPGTEWGDGQNSTMDNTLVRKPTIIQGDENGADVFDPSVQWNGFATDSFDNLGQHSAVTATQTPTPVPTPTIESTPTSTATPTESATFTPTPSPTTNPTPTASPSFEPTISPTPTVTSAPTAEPTASPSPTIEPTNSPVPSASPTPLGSPEPTAEAATASPSPSPLGSPEPTAEAATPTPLSSPKPTAEAATPAPVISQYKNFGQFISKIAHSCGRLVKYSVHSFKKQFHTSKKGNWPNPLNYSFHYKHSQIK